MRSQTFADQIQEKIPFILLKEGKLKQSKQKNPRLYNWSPIGPGN